MNTEVKGIHFEIDDKTRERIDKKLKQLDFAKDYIIDLTITLKHEKSSYEADSNINFRWGSNAHIHIGGYELWKCIDTLFDKMTHKVHKEKEKIQEHKGLRNE